MATHQFPQADINDPPTWDDLNDLSEEELANLHGWIDLFDRKYDRVGTLKEKKF